MGLTTQDNTMTSPGHGIDISPSSPSPFSCPIIVPRHALVGEASPGKAASDAELRSNTPRLIPPGKRTNGVVIVYTALFFSAIRFVYFDMFFVNIVERRLFGTASSDLV